MTLYFHNIMCHTIYLTNISFVLNYYKILKFHKQEGLNYSKCFAILEQINNICYKNHLFCQWKSVNATIFSMWQPSIQNFKWLPNKWMEELWKYWISCATHVNTIEMYFKSINLCYCQQVLICNYECRIQLNYI